MVELHIKIITVPLFCRFLRSFLIFFIKIIFDGEIGIISEKYIVSYKWFVMDFMLFSVLKSWRVSMNNAILF